MWLSLVERYVRDVEVASSNLVISTIKQKIGACPLFLFYHQGLKFELLKRLRLIALRFAFYELPLNIGAKLSSEFCHLHKKSEGSSSDFFFILISPYVERTCLPP